MSNSEGRVFPAGQIFHICNKSIANYGIFSFKGTAARFKQTLSYYNNQTPKVKLSEVLRKSSQKIEFKNLLLAQENSYVKIICYCIMPDHYHIVVRLNTEGTLPKYLNDVENSYSRFFNIKTKRKGPLWQSPFRAVLIESNEQLLHTTRYVHINPVTAGLVNDPEDWEHSSYRDYIGGAEYLKLLPEVSIQSPTAYKKFTEDQMDYQKKLKIIKKLMLD